MSQIDVSIKLRPIRFLFLVSPTDIKSLQKIFEINTCLWGGMYNPIIPFFKRVPTWWDRKPKSFYSARKILDYNLDFFEPVVKTMKELIIEGRTQEDVINFSEYPDFYPASTPERRRDSLAQWYQVYKKKLR